MTEIQSTQDKYRRAQKTQEPAKIKENEVRITTGGRVKNYVDYATRLFEGTTDNREHKPTQDSNNNNEDNNDKTDDNNDNNNEDNNNNNNNGDGKRPSKKFDSIVLKATGKAINKAVTTAEIVKRTIGDLHQETNVETLEIVDVWEPTEEGLQKVETTRRVASISIKLSRKAELVDVNAPGYQKPIPKETGFNMGMPFDRRDNRNYNNRGPRNNNRGPRNDNRDRRGPRGGGNRNNRNFNNRGPGGGYGGRGRGRRGGPRGFRGGPRGGPRGPRNNFRGGGGGNYPYRGQGGNGGGYNNGGGFNNNRGSPNRNFRGGGRRDGPRRGGRGGGFNGGNRGYNNY